MDWSRVLNDEIIEVFEIAQLGWTLSYATCGEGDVVRRLASIGRLKCGPALRSRVEGEVLRVFLAGRHAGRCIWPNSLLDDAPLRLFDGAQIRV